MAHFHEFELPGEDLVLRGLEDLRNGIQSVESLLVQIGAPRLNRLNFNVPSFDEGFPENKLYELLFRQDPDSAHSRMNALVRRLVGFEQSMEQLRR